MKEEPKKEETQKWVHLVEKRRGRVIKNEAYKVDEFVNKTLWKEQNVVKHIKQKMSTAENAIVAEANFFLKPIDKYNILHGWMFADKIIPKRSKSLFLRRNGVLNNAANKITKELNKAYWEGYAQAKKDLADEIKNLIQKDEEGQSTRHQRRAQNKKTGGKK